MGGPNSQMDTTSLQGKARRDVKVDKLEHGLARARASIKEAALNNKVRELDQDYLPEGPSYLNAYAFHRLVSHFVDFILVQSLYIYKQFSFAGVIWKWRNCSKSMCTKKVNLPCSMMDLVEVYMLRREGSSIAWTWIVVFEPGILV